MLKVHAAMHVGHHVKWFLKLPDLNENRNDLTVFTEFSIIKFHENLTEVLELFDVGRWPNSCTEQT
jgi:hypothetical protein